MNYLLISLGNFFIIVYENNYYSSRKKNSVIRLAISLDQKVIDPVKNLLVVIFFMMYSFWLRRSALLNIQTL
jgi:hypothetical protein